MGLAPFDVLVDYERRSLAHVVGLQKNAGLVAWSDLFAIVVFVALGVLLYRVAKR